MFNNSTQPRCSNASGLFRSDWFRIIPQITPILCSTAYFSVNFSHRAKISPFLFGGSRYSSYLCNRLQDDSNLSGRATVSPMASQPQAFFMPKSIIFPATGKRCTDMAAAWTVRFDLSSRISHHLVDNGECSRHPFLTKQVRCSCLQDDAICRILFY